MYRNPNMHSVTRGGPTGGTSIAALKSGNQGYNPYPQQQQQQPYPQYQGYYGQQVHVPEQHDPSVQPYDSPGIGTDEVDYVVDTIKDAIGVKKPSEDIVETAETEKEKKIKKKNEKKEGIKDSKKPNMFITIVKEFVLLWVIYMAMSLKPIREFASKYIKALQPDDSGVVNIYGIALYGLIFCILYFIFRYVLLKKFI